MLIFMVLYKNKCFEMNHAFFFPNYFSLFLNSHYLTVLLIPYLTEQQSSRLYWT